MDVCGQAERCFQGIPHPGRAVRPLAGDADKGIGQSENRVKKMVCRALLMCTTLGSLGYPWGPLSW